MVMNLALGRSLLVVFVALFACGPSVRGDDDGTATRGDASGSTGEEASTTSSPPASTGPEVMTGTVTTSGDVTTFADDSTSGATTGSSREPVGCYDGEFPDPGDDQCCPELSQPCPVVPYECPDELDCQPTPFAAPVLDSMAAQCMLAALAEGGAARLDQSVEYGLGGTHRQWLVDASGDVTLVRTDYQDFSFVFSFMECQLVEAGLAECATEADPQVLSDCLTAALEGCEATTEPVCPG